MSPIPMVIPCLEEGLGRGPDRLDRGGGPTACPAPSRCNAAPVPGSWTKATRGPVGRVARQDPEGAAVRITRPSGDAIRTISC